MQYRLYKPTDLLFWLVWGFNFRAVGVFVRLFHVGRLHREEVSLLVVRGAWNSSPVVRCESFVILDEIVKFLQFKVPLRRYFAWRVASLAYYR